MCGPRVTSESPVVTMQNCSPASNARREAPGNDERQERKSERGSFSSHVAEDCAGITHDINLTLPPPLKDQTGVLRRF